MNKNYFKYSVFSLLFFITNMLFAQNFIYNGGFEYGNYLGAVSSVGNSGSSTIPHLDIWEKADIHNDHSPDWWRKGAPSSNFETPNANTHDNANYYPLTPPYAYYYDEVLPHTGYGMLGFYEYELIQQKFNADALRDQINLTGSKTITLRFWVQMSTKHPPTNSKLRVFLAKKRMAYKDETGICEDQFKEYKVVPTKRKEVVGIDNIGSVYPRGQWHLVERTFDVPNDIDVYNWIVFDLQNDDCPKNYIFIDDVEMTVGCINTCSATDGPLYNPVTGNVIHASSPFTMDNISNVKSIRLEVFLNNGAIVLFDETASCVNGFDHPLYWDGTSSSGAPVSWGIYGYRITMRNDCGERILTGSLLKTVDYAGSNTTNFNEPCLNGVNSTPEPCCWENPDFYINNQTLIGPDPGWSSFIIPYNIWACTSQPDYSDQVVVENQARVLFRAGKQITLREGFNTERGAVFCAEIDPCARPEEPEGKANNGRSTEQRDVEEVIPIKTTSPILIYPNPTNDWITLDINELYSPKKDYQIAIYDLLGNRLTVFSMDSPTLQIDLQKYPQGVYLVHIFDGETKYNIKVVKK